MAKVDVDALIDDYMTAYNKVVSYRNEYYSHLVDFAHARGYDEEKTMAFVEFVSNLDDRKNDEVSNEEAFVQMVGKYIRFLNDEDDYADNANMEAADSDIVQEADSDVSDGGNDTVY